MPTILASAILDKASTILQDTTNIRWPSAELLGWLNDAQREVVAARPDQGAKYANMPLVAGTKQTLPSDCIELMRVVRNMGVAGAVPGPAIRKVPHEILDAQVPGWHSATAAAVIKHITYDPRSPHVFYTYPPSDATTQLEVLYVAVPTLLATTASVLTVDDVFANILLDYVLYRAYSKNMEDGGDAERAGLHKKMFTESLTMKSAADGNVMPQDQVKG